MASQYYAQIGIGNVARPMVVGDRLWLFSQTPGNNTTPASRTILNNSNNASTGTRFHNYDGSQVVAISNSSSVQMPMFGNYLPPCSYLPSENVANVTPNYRPDSFYHEYLSSAQTKYSNVLTNKFNKDYRPISDSYTPTSTQSKSFLNKLFWPNSFTNKPIDKTFDNNYDRLKLQNDLYGSSYSGSSIEANASSSTHTDFALSSRDVGGIAELERVFGSNDKGKQSFSPISKPNKIDENKNNGALDYSDCFSENSDVDCERL